MQYKQLANDLIANDQLREALDLLMAHTPPEAAETLLNLSGQLTATERAASLQLKTEDQLTVERNVLRAALLEQLRLADKAKTPVATAGIRLKKTAFYALIAMKVLLLLFLLFHFSTNGYGQGETLTLLLLLMPVLVGYFIKAADTWRIPTLSEAAKRNLPLLKTAVWVGFPLYFFALCWILNQHPEGNWAFETVRNWITGIEASFGALLLFVVNTLFGDK